MSKDASSQHIEIYLRARPVPSLSEQVVVDDEENRVEITLPKDAATGAVNNQQERFVFRFNGVFGPEATQDEVFEVVAKDVVLSALDGVNGTCFAYGATGSGKTFTITGGASRYADRGLIPRALSLAFETMAERADCTYEVYVSYLEIYNDAGYDLLDPGREATRLEELPRVTVYEDEQGATRLRNLALHPAADVEAALNLVRAKHDMLAGDQGKSSQGIRQLLKPAELCPAYQWLAETGAGANWTGELFLGDTNRAISETPMNLASSRSHCIFTLHIASRQVGRDTVRRSKLHMVDLAGSERIKRSGMEGGTLLREAKHINLSLHFLEQVIVALQERTTSGRAHVPYRNSMMTLVLRDSLGGNCHTVMIATVAPAGEQLLESVSTCRFAQRVALIANEVVVNEEEDPLLVVARLRQEVADLRAELRMVRGDDEAQPWDATPQEASRKLAAVQAAADAFFHDSSPAAALQIDPPRMPLFQAAFARLKALARWTSSGSSAELDTGQEERSRAEVSELQAQVAKLEDQVRQRDAEVAVLVGMGPGNRCTAQADASPSPSQLKIASMPSEATSKEQPTNGKHRHPREGRGRHSKEHGHSQEVQGNGHAPLQAAFEEFCRGYAGEAEMQASKAVLAARYSEAKALANQVNECKQRIDDLKAGIEKGRVQRALPRLSMGKLPGNDFAVAEPDAEEQHARHQLDQEKATYRTCFTLLKAKKSEIEQLHEAVKAARAQVQADFQQWLQPRNMPLQD